MAKKNPNSPEWIARCIDAAAAFSDGSKMQTKKDSYTPTWDLYITVPRFFGMGEDSAKKGRECEQNSVS